MSDGFDVLKSVSDGNSNDVSHMVMLMVMVMLIVMLMLWQVPLLYGNSLSVVSLITLLATLIW